MNSEMLFSFLLRVNAWPVLAALDDLEPRKGGNTLLYLAGVALLLIIAFLLVIVMFSYGKLWVQAVMSNAHVSLFTLIGMSLRQVQARTIVEAKIRAVHA